MGDTTAQDPAHFAPLEDGYPHVLSGGCGCAPARYDQPDGWDGPFHALIHHRGGPGGPPAWAPAPEDYAGPMTTTPGSPASGGVVPDGHGGYLADGTDPQIPAGTPITADGTPKYSNGWGEFS